ncbi:MAG TPA: BrnA antitoxin family protein [Rhodanobacter sp.]|nr:BrnA antitoxin family protein [Rhodanobacter sp.]
MNEKLTTALTRKADVPYNPKSKTATLEYWESAIAHKGVAELRAKRGRPTKAAAERKEQIALRVDKEVLEWYRAQGNGWQTRMNAVLKAFRDATI